jgi:hypothetical protein
LQIGRELPGGWPLGEPPGLLHFPDFAIFAEKNEIAGRSDADTLVEWCDFASGWARIPANLLAPLAICFRSSRPTPSGQIVVQTGKIIACCGICTGFALF